MDSRVNSDHPRQPPPDSSDLEDDFVQRVFVIDDEPTSRLILSRMASLLSGPVAVFTFESATEAIEAAIDTPPALSVCDYYMRPTTGIAYTQAIRESSSPARHSPIFLVTAHENPSLYRSSLEAGVTGFFTKPLRPLHFQTRCQALLDIATHNEVLRRSGRLDVDTQAALEKAVQESGVPPRRLRTIAQTAGLTCSALGVSEDLRARVEQMAYFHDVGLHALSPDFSDAATVDRASLQKHTVIGDELLRSASSKPLEVAALIARNHHERHDGRGFPDRLGSEDIPFEAAVVGIAQRLTAMQFPRDDRTPLSSEEIRSTLQQERGKAFSPILCDAVLDNPRLFGLA